MDDWKAQAEAHQLSATRQQREARVSVMFTGPKGDAQTVFTALSREGAEGCLVTVNKQKETTILGDGDDDFGAQRMVVYISPDQGCLLINDQHVNVMSTCFLAVLFC